MPIIGSMPATYLIKVSSDKDNQTVVNDMKGLLAVSVLLQCHIKIKVSVFLSPEHRFLAQVKLFNASSRGVHILLQIFLWYEPCA